MSQSSYLYPWPKVKNLRTLKLKKDSWKEIYTNLDPCAIDPFQEAADFYLLFGMVNSSFVSYKSRKLPTTQAAVAAAKTLQLGIEDFAVRNAYIQQLKSQGIDDSLTKMETQAQQMLNELIERLDLPFREYVALACGGEVRHHPSMVEHYPNTRRIAWCGWPEIVEVYGIEAYTTMAGLFRDFAKNTSYGGELWAAAAELLRDRLLGKLGPSEQINKQMFIDRVFTLQHNGGCFLNKLSWGNKRFARRDPFDYEISMMPSTVLAFQASNPPNIQMMFGYASPPVQELLKGYMDLALNRRLNLKSKWTSNLKVDVEDPTIVPPVQYGEDQEEDYEEDEFETFILPPSYLEIPSISGNVHNKTFTHDFSQDGINIYFTQKKFFIYPKYWWEFDITVSHDQGPPVTKSYSFEEEDLIDKKFYPKHILKSKYPGAVVQEVTIRTESTEIPKKLTIFNDQGIYLLPYFKMEMCKFPHPAKPHQA